MPNCTTPEFTFPSFDRRKIEANFAGGDVSSDGGIVLLREADRRLGLIAALDAVLADPRNPDLITHRQADLLRQRIYGLALGYEDLNDHGALRRDLAWQTALERDTELASSPTLCRLEQRVDRKAAVAFHEVLLEKFIASFAEAPKELILDFDATDDRVHGNQEGRFYHGYYGDWCFLPLYVFCGEQLLVAYLRPSDGDGARHAWAILKLLTKRLREAWPAVRLIVRADSGFCRPKMLHWCEWASVDYIIGLARNPRLEKLGAPLMAEAQTAFATAPGKQRLFGWIDYAADSWDRPRRVTRSQRLPTLRLRRNNPRRNPCLTPMATKTAGPNGPPPPPRIRPKGRRSKSRWLKSKSFAAISATPSLASTNSPMPSSRRNASRRSAKKKFSPCGKRSARSRASGSKPAH